ncbi:MAG: phage antirepressor [Oscillospiraceae bacterium]
MMQIYNYEGNDVRTVNQNVEPWWVLKDVCDVLDLSNSRMASDRLDEDEKGVSIVDTLGGEQEMTVISESGLYNVIFLSRKPQAKKFKRWVTHEVLPSIRKHGVYAVDAVLANPDMMIAALQELKAERNKSKVLSETVAVQNQQIVEMKPKVSYYDVVLNCKDLVAISVIAKDYGWSANRMNRYLHDKGVQFKQSAIWLLYQKYAEKGYTSTKTHSYPANDGSVHTKVHTYWTQKGRLFVYGLMKEDGYLPLIEQEDFYED